MRRAVEEMNKKMAEAMVAGDINTVSSLYAPDAISQPDYKPKLKGLQTSLMTLKRILPPVLNIPQFTLKQLIIKRWKFSQDCLISRKHKNKVGVVSKLRFE